jgi:tetratricopeptide (TPR) repeat protein
LLEGDTVAANGYIKKYISVCSEQSNLMSSIVDDIGLIYSEANFPDKAEEYKREALAIAPEQEKAYRLWSLANFLINKDRKITEGLDLIDKALLLTPDISTLLGTKGWGLYKLGRYKESLDVLQRAWDLAPVYNYTLKSHLEAARKAVAGMK